jgi:hypothetical protein
VAALRAIEPMKARIMMAGASARISRAMPPKHAQCSAPLHLRHQPAPRQPQSEQRCAARAARAEGGGARRRSARVLG